jgi:hypothetical protein
MAIYWSNYTDTYEGLHYKMGRSDGGDPHLLCSDDLGSLRKDGNILFHIHYWRRKGQWYLQITKGNLKLLEDNSAFESVRVYKHLDEVLKRLGG